jgi:hypothetical protein
MHRILCRHSKFLAICPIDQAASRPDGQHGEEASTLNQVDTAEAEISG